MSWFFLSPQTPGEHVERLQETVERARLQKESNAAQNDIRTLREDLDRLHLVCRAMWEMLKQETGATDEALVERIQQLDLSDGKLDGRVRVDVVDCVACGRKIGRRHRRCIYCGAPRMDQAPF